VKISNRIRYYYEHVLRYDLLLKLDYTNIMEVPQLCKILILAKKVPYNHLKNVSLALEIICGQKTSYNLLPDSMTPRRLASRSPIGRKDWRPAARQSDSPRGASQSNLVFIFCSLRSQVMFNFLDKLFSFSALSESSNQYKIQIRGQEIQVKGRLSAEFHLFPEIQNHFEFFEHFQNLEIKLITSAKSENETRLLWAGLQQKEI